MSETRVVLKIRGMDCEGCAQTIGHSLKRIQGVQEVKIDWKTGLGEVSFDAGLTSEAEILESPVLHSAYEAAVVPG